MPAIQTKTKIQTPTLRTSQSNSMTSTGGHRWLVGKPLLVAFQRTISELQLRSPSPVASGASLFFFPLRTKPRLAHFAIKIGDLKWRLEIARWKATSKGLSNEPSMTSIRGH